MTPIEQLKSAGFDEKEIGDWSAQQRSTLSQAGFSDDEINTYLTGPKEPVPQAFTDRMKSGVAILDNKVPPAKPEEDSRDAFPEVSMGDYGPGNFLIGLWKGLTTPAAEMKQRLGAAGPGETAGAIAGRLPVGQIIDQIRQGGESLKAVMSGEPISAEEMVGNAMLGITPAPITRMPFGPITRLERDPLTGGLREAPVGELPTITDFGNAAQSIAGSDAPHPAITEKLKQLWHDDGIHPSEVAHDARIDPTITQDMLSATPRLPETYRPAETPAAAEAAPKTELDALAEKHGAPVAAGPQETAANIVQRIGPESAAAEAERLAGEHDKLMEAFDAAQQGETEAGTPEGVPSDAGREPGAVATGSDEAGISGGGRGPEPGSSPEPAGPPDNAAAAAGVDNDRLFFEPQRETPPVGMGLSAPTRTLSQAEQTILSHIDVGGKTTRPPLTISSIYTNLVDRLHPIPDRDAAGNILPTSKNPYQLMRLLAGNPARASSWLREGQVDFTTGNKVGPGLEEILGASRRDLDPLRAYIDSVRAIELEGKGINTGFDMDAAHQVVQAGQKEFGPVMDQLVQFQNNLVKYLRDAGVVSPEAFDAMTTEHQNYIPFHAVLDEEGRPHGAAGMQPQNPLFKIEGSSRTKIDPLESIVEHTYRYVAMAERNRAANAMVDLLESMGQAKPATDATAAANKVRIFDQGVEKFWEVPKDIADAVKNVDGETAGWLARWLSSDNRLMSGAAQLATAPARTLRAGATLTPDFVLRNPIRDYFSALLQSEKPLYTPIDSFKGFYSAVTKDEYFRRWMQGGGGNAELVAMDRRYLQADLEKLTQETGLGNRAWNVVRHPVEAALDFMRTVSEYGEQSTRLGEFRYVYDREIAKGATPADASRTAAFSSREVTVDFARRGAITQSLNMLDAFWNAGLQGVDRFARQLTNNPVETSLKAAAGITLPSVLLWYANHDDPRYREMPGWERDMFWNVMTNHWVDMGEAPGQADTQPYADGGASWRVNGGRYQRNDGWIIRLPKPFEAGVMFGSGVERLLDAFLTDNPSRGGDFLKSVENTLVPMPGVTAVTPFLEQWGNKSSFTGQTLIPQYLEKQAPEYQYTPYTTELTKKLGQIIGAFPGMRDWAMSDTPGAGVAQALTTPILLENYLRAWTGGGGTYALQLADAALRKQGVLPDPGKPDDTLADIPVVKAFVVRYPSASTDSVQNFYSEYTQNQRYFTTWKSLAASGDLEAAQRIQASGGMRMFVQLDAIHATMGKQAKMIRDINENPEIKSKEKRQLIDTLYYGQIQLARSGLDMLRQVDTMQPKQ